MLRHKALCEVWKIISLSTYRIFLHYLYTSNVLQSVMCESFTVKVTRTRGYLKWYLDWIHFKKSNCGMSKWKNFQMVTINYSADADEVSMARTGVHSTRYSYWTGRNVLVKNWLDPLERTPLENDIMERNCFTSRIFWSKKFQGTFFTRMIIDIFSWFCSFTLEIRVWIRQSCCFLRLC